MVPYIILAIIVFGFVLFEPKLTDKSRKKLFVLLGILLASFAVLRSPYSNMDCTTYRALYEKAPSLSILLEDIQKYNDSLLTEFSYSAFSSLLKETGNSEKTNLCIIYSFYVLLGVFFKLRGIYRLTDLKNLSLMIYFSNLFFLQELTQVRAGVAIGLVFISIDYLQKKEYGKYLFTFFMAVFFHTSAFLTIILPLLKKVKASLLIWGILISFCVVVCVCEINIVNLVKVIPIDYFQFKLKAYIELQQLNAVKINYFNVMFLLQNFIIVLCFIYKDNLKDENKNINLFINMCCLSTCCFLFFWQIPGFAFRISEIFNSVLVILIPMLVKFIKPKAVSELIVFIIGIGIFCFNVFLSDYVLEYKLLWN